MEGGPESAKRQQLALEVCSNVRKVLDGMRMYAAGHSVIEQQIDKLFEHVTAYGALGDDLTFGVTSLALTYGDKPLQPVARLEESLAHPLFADGVQRLTLAKGCSREEVARLIALWRSAIDGKLGNSHTFATRFWESDFRHLHLAVGELLIEAEGEQKGAETRQNQVELLTARLLGSAPASADAQVTRGRTPAPPGELGIPPMSAAAAQALSKELEASNARALPRAVGALLAVAPFAKGAELDGLMQLGAGAFTAQTRAGKWEVAAALLQELIAEARAIPEAMEARFSILQKMFAALGQPPLIEAAARALDDTATRPHAEAVLRVMPPQTAPMLLEALAVPKTPEGRQQLGAFVAASKPAPEMLVAKLKGATPEQALGLLSVAAALEPAPRWTARSAAAGHPAPAVRLAVLESLTKDELVAQRARLATLFADPDSKVRNVVFGALGATPDRMAVPHLVRLVGLKEADSAERKRAVAALGKAGGGEACAALRRILEGDKDVEVRCACAQALGAAGDETARTLLKEHAGKLIGGGPLKAACAEALKKLDEKKAGR
jgi:HEAT repeat protein